MADAPVSSGDPLQPDEPERPGEVRGPVSVVLADDQALMRMGFRMVLEAEEDITVVGEASDGTAALAQAKALHPDVILMDVRMPGMNGIEATEHIAQECPSTRVLILTTFDLDEYAFAGLRAGASGFLLKDTRPTELAEAIRTVASGEAVVSPRITQRMLEMFASSLPNSGKPAQPSDPRIDSLTPREKEILVLMNLSGGPVSGLVSYYGIDPAARLLVIHDELDLPAHELRLKRGGGEGGHNGLRSISKSVSTKDYARLRVGIGRPPGRQDPSDFVLSDFPGRDRADLGVALEQAADAVEQVVTLGFDAAQQRLHAPR